MKKRTGNGGKTSPFDVFNIGSEVSRVIDFAFKEDTCYFVVNEVSRLVFVSRFHQEVI